MATLGDRLRSLREKKGLSLQAAAELSGFHRQTIHNWEVGKKIPTVTHAYSYIQQLGFNDLNLLRFDQPAQ